MIKRTKGYILLTLLVVTGLASQVPKQTLTGKERKHLVSGLKESKAGFLLSIKNLNESQLTFKPTGKPSINEWIQRQALFEEALWQIVKNEIEHPSTQKNSVPPTITEIKISEIKDMKKANVAYPQHVALPAHKAFEEARNKLILYAKTTTDNARLHYVSTPFGTISLYNVILSTTANTVFYTQQINDVKKQPGFPD